MTHDGFRAAPHGRRAVISLVVVVGLLTGACTSSTQSGSSSTPSSSPNHVTSVDKGIFSGMGGWIAYAGTNGYIDAYGIWAMDPERRGVRTRLSTHLGEPLAWSSDGSKLLILSRSQHALSVLNPDGSETLLIDAGPRKYLSSGSFSPDGSEVVYANDSGIYVVDAAGGTPMRLLKAGPRPVFGPAFSPDGSQIAYFEGHGDSGSNSLRVMNADGSGSHILLRDAGFVPSDPVWSPDGRRLAFGVGHSGTIYVVGADGSGLTRLIAHGALPEWSPGGSRIAYDGLNTSGVRRLAIADADGTHIQWFSYAQSGPWNPLARAES